MRKMLSCLCIVSLLIQIFTLSVSARGNDKEQIKELKGLTDEILETVNASYGMKYNSKCAGAEDVDFEKAYKVYVDINLFQDSEVTEAELESMLIDAPEVWCVPIYYSDVTAIVEISKGLPLNPEAESILTPEQKQEIIDNEGQWIVSRYTFYEGTLDYKQNIKDILSESKVSVDLNKCVLLGGIPGIQKVVVAVIEDGYLTKMLLPGSTSTVPTQTKATSGLNENQVYSYSDFRNLVVKEGSVLKDATSGMSGFGGVDDNNVLIYQVALIGGVILILGVILYFRKRKGREQ